MFKALIRHLSLALLLFIILSFVAYHIMMRDPLNQHIADKNFYLDYWHYIRTLLQGDLGITYNGGESLTTQILAVLPATLELCIVALFLAVLFAIPVGLLGAINSENIVGRTIRIISSFGLSIPIYWVGSILLYFAAINNWQVSAIGQYNQLYDITPVTGFAIVDVWFIEQPYKIKVIQNVLQHLALPALVLMITPFMEVVRLVQQQAEKVLSQTYAKVAITRGWSKCKILRLTVVRNTLAPQVPEIIRLFTLTFALCMLIENIFSWGGIGQWLISAFSAQDYNAIASGVLVIGLIVIMTNLIANFSAFLLDPLNRKGWYEK